MRYLSDVLKQQYGEKVYKISLSSGCTCPNRDGKAGFGGCAFCSEGGSGEYTSQAEDIDVQIEEAKRRIREKTNARRFIAYFQSFTNTYGDVNRLAELYEAVIRREDMHQVNGMCIANSKTNKHLRKYAGKIAFEGEETFLSLDPSIRKEYEGNKPIIVVPADIEFDRELQEIIEAFTRRDITYERASRDLHMTRNTLYKLQKRALEMLIRIYNSHASY